MNSAKLYVEQNLQALRHFTKDGQRIFGDPTPVYEFLLDIGQEWTGTHWREFRGSGWRRMKPRHCFENSFRAACEYNLTYCEGFAFSGFISVHHAWCLDSKGRVVDFTWSEKMQTFLPPNEWEYFGVKFNLDKLARFMAGRSEWSCLYSLPYADDEDATIDSLITA